MSIDPAGQPHGILRYAVTPGSSSFAEFVRSASPELLPGNVADGAAVPHGTTIVAAAYADGVIMGGDRRATAGNLIAQRDIEKVFQADDHTLVGIAGVAGLAIEIVRLYQVELEHYEKIEGTPAHPRRQGQPALATMIRGNLGMAMQGLAVVPLFAGFDVDAADAASRGQDLQLRRRPAAGIPEQHFHSVGSGSLFARGSLKKLWSPRPGSRRSRSGSPSRRSTTPPTTTRPPVVRTSPGASIRSIRLATVSQVLRTGGRRRTRRPSSARSSPTANPAPAPEPPGTYDDPLQGDDPPCRCRSMPRPSRSCATVRSSPGRASPAAAASSYSTYTDGVLFVAENASSALHKVSEIYDRIGFAAVGKLQRVREPARGRHPAGRPARLLL